MFRQRTRRALRAATAAAALLASPAALPASPSGGTAPPVALLGPGIAGASGPRLAANADGDVVGVWIHSLNEVDRVEARYKPAGGAWGAAKLVSPQGMGANSPGVVVDSAGNATVVWVRPDASFNNRVQAIRRSANGTWSTVKTLSPAGQSAIDVSIAGDPKGDVVVSWDRYDGTFNRTQATVRAAGGTWGAVKTLSPAGMGVFEPNVAIGAGGDAAVIWQASGGPVQIARRPAGGTWSASSDLVPNGIIGQEPDVAVDGHGVITAIWRRSDGNDVLIEARRRTSSGWGAPTFISAAGFATDIRPHVEADPAGDVFAIWQRIDSTFSVHTAFRPAGQPWGADTQRTALGYRPRSRGWRSTTTGMPRPRGRPRAPWTAGSRAADGSPVAPGRQSRICRPRARMHRRLPWPWTVTGPFGWPGRSRRAASTGSRLRTAPQEAPGPLRPTSRPPDPEESLMPMRRRLMRSAIPATAIVLALAGMNATHGQHAGGSHLRLVGTTIGDAGGATIAVNSEGDAIAAWYRSVDGLHQIQAKFRPAGGHWTAARTLMSGANAYGAPEVAIDAQGNAAVLWLRDVFNAQTSMTENRIQSAWRAKGKPEATAWSAVSTLSKAGESALGGYDLAMDAHGNMTATWTTFQGSLYPVQVARRSLTGGWSAPKVFQPLVSAAGPQVAADANGDVLLVWQSVEADPRVLSVRRPAGKKWGSIVPLSPLGQHPDPARIGLDAKGHAVAAWRGVVNNTNVIVAKTFNGTTWSAFKVVSDPTAQASCPPNLAVSANGDAYIGWCGVDHSKNRAQLVRRPAGGAWSQPVMLSSLAVGSDAATVAVNARGDAVAMWAPYGPDGGWIDASFRKAGGDWTLAYDVTQPGDLVGGPVPALDNHGVVQAVVQTHNPITNVNRIQTLRRLGNGTWTARTDLSDEF